MLSDKHHAKLRSPKPMLTPVVHVPARFSVISISYRITSKLSLHLRRSPQAPVAMMADQQLVAELLNHSAEKKGSSEVDDTTSLSKSFPLLCAATHRAFPNFWYGWHKISTSHL